jgi:hypothetical protein
MPSRISPSGADVPHIGADADLTDWATGKGTVKLPYGELAPVDLLRRMIAYLRSRTRERGRPLDVTAS